MNHIIKIKDRNGQLLLNFPMITQLVGRTKKNKLTDPNEGTLTVVTNKSSVDIFILAPSEQPDTVKLEEGSDHSYYKLLTLDPIQSLPSELTSPYALADYGIAQTKYLFYDNQTDKNLYPTDLLVEVTYLSGEDKKKSPKFVQTHETVKNGELNITSVLHNRIEIQPYKPDYTPLKTQPISYNPRTTDPITIPVYFDVHVTSGITGVDKPTTTTTVNNQICFCNRDLTIKEFLGILKGMRDTEKALKGNILILNHPACSVIGNKDHNSLLQVINSTMSKYQINTCIRKLHFLAQTYWESDRFRTTGEYSSGNYLNPGRHPQAEKNENTVIGDGPRYKGRGFMQLTWRKNYRRYFEYIKKNPTQYLDIFPKNVSLENLLNRKDHYPDFVASNLFLAMDSAGWFWNYGVLLKNGNSADINSKADQDDINKISLWVNGGGNGRKERIEYWKNLKQVMNYEKCINKK